MKKIWIKSKLKYILIIGITAIICISGTVFATGYLAKDVSYTREETNIKSVEEALNDLYAKEKGNISIEVIDSFTYSYSNYGQKTFDIKNIKGWEKFELENFSVRVNKYQLYGALSAGASGDTGEVEIKILSYENGMLTINFPRHTRGGGYSVMMNVDILVTYVK